MKKIEVEVNKLNDLRERIDELLRLVEEKGETIELTRHGKTFAHVVPIDEPERANEKDIQTFLADIDRLAVEIDVHWTGDMSAVEAVHDVRREL